MRLPDRFAFDSSQHISSLGNKNLADVEMIRVVVVTVQTASCRTRYKIRLTK